MISYLKSNIQSITKSPSPSPSVSDDDHDSSDTSSVDEDKPAVITYWQCKRCTFLNPERDNFYNCDMCDIFQPRSRTLPEEYQNNLWHLVQHFPAQATNLMRHQYYQFNLQISAPKDAGLPSEINVLVASFLMYSYDAGDCVDVMFQRVWYSAEVMERKEDQLLITYHGWGQQWNEWIPYDSPRLEPHRSKSVGDTSASKTRHLFRPRPFCPDANLMYEFRVLGHNEQRASAALEFTRNHRTDALNMLTEAETFMDNAQPLEPEEELSSFLQALQQVQQNSQYRPRPSPSYPSWE